MAAQKKTCSDSANGYSVTIYWDADYGDTTTYVTFSENSDTYGNKTYQLVERYATSNRYDSGATLSTSKEYYLYVYKNGTYLKQHGPYTFSAPESTEPDESDVSASDVSLGADTVQMGDRLLISIDRDNPDCEHYLTCWFSDDVELDIADNVGTSYAWTVPDLAYLCNNKLSETFWIVCYTYYDGEYIDYTEEEVTLTVPDTTTPSVDGGKVILGQTCSIACPRNSSNFTVKLEFEFKNTTLSITSGKINSASCTPPYDLAKLIPNLTSATGTLKCTTMNGTATVGTKTATIQVIVPENDVTRPSFKLSGLVLTPITTLGNEFAGMYLRGKTGLNAEMTAASTYSTIQTYSITVGSLTAQGNPAVINLLLNEGDVKVTAKVTDARGFSTTVTTSIYIVPYRNPKVTPYTGYSDVICERAKANGELSADGTYLAIKAGKSYSSVTLNGVEKNSCSLRYRWKPNGADAYSNWITLLADGSAKTEINILVGNVVSSLQTSYMVQIEAVDALDGRHTLTFQIMTEAISFVLYDGPDGAGFGKYPEEPHVVDIASHMTLRVWGKLEVPGEQFVDLGLSESVSESSGYIGQIESGCQYIISNGNCVTVLFNCSFSYQGQFLRVNETPIPEKLRPNRIPTNCFAGIRPNQSATLVMAFVDTDGYIWIAGSIDGNVEISSVDGRIEYYIF